MESQKVEPATEAGGFDGIPLSRMPSRAPFKQVFKIPHSDLIAYSWKNVDVWVGKKGVDTLMRSQKVAPSHDNLDARTVVNAKWESESKASVAGTTAVNTGQSEQAEGQNKKWKCPWKSTLHRTGKHLVHNASGIVKPGELVALMGPSGAGKTTLLNVLTYRSKRPLSWTGQTFINGMKVGPKEVTAVSAYIQQEDIFFGTLTVFEHLVFYSNLLMDKKYSKAERMAKVIEVMDEFGLTKCKDTKIGVHGRIKGISGGEMKRLAFASEVLTEPPLLFCDEPTSGLDSYMAETVVHVMQMLAAAGTTIICTIHQPSSQVFKMFDRILLLSEGRVVYMGGVDPALKFFAARGRVCPSNYNPADFFSHALAIVPGKAKECKEFVNDICDDFQKTPEHIQMLADIDNPGVIDPVYKRKMEDYRHKSPYKASITLMFRTVFCRSWSSTIQDYEIIIVRLLQSIILALMIGAVYWDNEIDPVIMEHNRLSDIAGALYLSIANMSFLNMFAVIDGFLGEVPVFLREHFNGMYRVDVYFISRMVTDLPFFLLYPLVFHCIAYAMIRFQWSWGPFLQHGLVIILVAQVASSFAYFLSCVCTDLATALMVGPGMLIPLMLFSGYFIKTPNMQPWNEWVTYISWFYFAVESLMVTQMSAVTKIDCKYTPYENFTQDSIDNGEQPYFNCSELYNGEALLKSYDFKTDQFYFPNMFVLAVMAAVFRIAAYVALLLKTVRRG